MPRIQGLKESAIIQADQSLKTGEGYVFSLTVGFKGVTVGDFITLHDGTSMGDGNDIVAIFFPTANGTLHLEWAQGKKFDNGIFVNIGPTGGQVEVAVTFK